MLSSSTSSSTMSSSATDGEVDAEEDVEREHRTRASTLRRREERKRRLERVGLDVERWAADLLSERDDDDGGGAEDRRWREISCNNFVRKKFNRDGNTRVYLKVRSIHLVVRRLFFC